jgi:hypothetical protein
MVNWKEIRSLSLKHTPEQVEAMIVHLFMAQLNTRDLKNGFLAGIIDKVEKESLIEARKCFAGGRLQLSIDMLPSIFDSLVTAEQRRTVGAFYTPKIVADFLSDQTISAGDEVICDPACGSGALLLAAVKRMNQCGRKSIIRLLEDNVYGVDIEPAFVRRSKILLSLLALQNGEDEESIAFNIHVGDSLGLDWRRAFARVFSEDGGFDTVLCNPPYRSVEGERAQYSDTAALNGNKNLTRGTYLRFIELLFQLSKPKDSTSGYVVPLSLSYNVAKPFVDARTRILASEGEWFFSFYDRSPDSLFGDDVKTRNCIFIYRRHPSRTRIYTTHLIRWNSKIRNKLFSRLKYLQIERLNVTDGIPKMSDPVEMEAMLKVSVDNLKLKGTVGFGRVSDEQLALFRSEGIVGRKVFFYPTAYNWLSVFRTRPRSDSDKEGSPITNSLTSIVCRSSEDADFIYSCLNSRLAYWYWLVYGDGFHLDRRLIGEMPFNPSYYNDEVRNEIAKIGRELHNCARRHLVFKTNAGKRVLNYNMLQCAGIVEKIDGKLISSLGLQGSFNTFLRRRISAHLEAGRERLKNRGLPS